MQKRWTEGTFQSLLDSAPDAMVIVDTDGSIVLVNSQAEQVFGYSRDELLGQKIELLLPERYHGAHIGQRDSYFRAPRVRPMGAGYDLFGRHKDGHEFPVEICLSPLQTEGGLLVTSAIRDITDRKRVEQELKRARQAADDARVVADEANRAKSEFLANMSHEIRTPLAGILGYLEMLEHYCKTDEERKDYITKTRRNANNLTELINDILDLSKVEAGALKVEQLKFPLMTEVESVLSLLQSQAEGKGIVLETSIERPVPTHIVSDPKRLRQVLINILGNSIKFTQEGRVQVKIRVDRPSGNQKPLLSFIISDTGCGIPAEVHSKLFEPFVQADSSTTREYGGTGLGLALSRRLARALGGDIVLTESIPGKGSAFTITIDPGSAEQSAKIEMYAEMETLPPNSASLRVDGIRVLLAEDRLDNEELITQFLTRAGASVEVANNGAEAVALANSKDFDVVLMDLQMPVMDGYAATSQLRKEGYNVPIIALTAHAMLEEREKCAKAGCSDFLTKPLDVTALLRTVKKYSARKHES